MSCVPGMPCYQNTTSTESGCNPEIVFSQFPCGCAPCLINSTNVIYTGNNLPNTGVNTNDNLTTILLKIDNAIGSGGGGGSFTLTTTGDSGPSTFSSNVLNIPNYSISGIGGVPTGRILSINGVGFDLSMNRSWTVGDIISSGSYSNPSWITSLTWSKITSTPTTLSGYGITDAVPSSRTLTINGVTQDLSANRTWTITTSPAGADTQIQYNNGGVLGASSAFTWNNSTSILTVSSVRLLSPNGSGSGDPNLFLGNGVGVTNPTNGLNTAIGYLSMSSLTTGSQNTAFGTYAFLQGTTGSQNTAIGYLALGNGVVTGSRNIGIGRSAMSSLTSGSDNTAMGYNAGGSIHDGLDNTIIGSTAGTSLTDGYDNTIIGYSAFITNIHGHDNTHIGVSAGGQDTGNYNTCVGSAAGENMHIGSNNTLIGYAAGSENGIVGSGNTVVGSTSLSDYGFSSGTSGSYNTILGYVAATSITTGSSNIVIGHLASGNSDPTVMITTGSQNVVIGERANVPSSTSDGQLSIQNAIYGVSNTLNITGDAIATGNIGFYTKSPTARVHLPAGTATAGTAPLKITPGVLLSITENGAIETDGTHLYWTDNGGTRHMII